MLVYLTIYYTSKISKIKTGVVHKNITFRLFKKYTFDVYKDALKKLNFTNYKLFNDVNEAYSNFFQKIKTVIDNIAICKTKRVKTNTQKRFDVEILEKKIVGTSFSKDLRNLDFILIKSCTKINK